MVQPPREPASHRASRHGKHPFALTVLCTILFLTFLDNTIVSVALGSVWGSMHASVSQLQWVVGAYALTFASAMLVFGMVGDEFGRKKTMLSGAAVFCAGSVLSAVAPNIGILIVGRAVMGLGAAASEPGTLSMLRQLYADERLRARAVGIWTAVGALALAFGPVIGGVLIGLWSWRAVFWFNLIFGLAALLAAAVVLPESSDPTGQLRKVDGRGKVRSGASRVDIRGAVLGAASLTALCYAIIQAETSGFKAPVVLILLVVAVIAGAAFIWEEHRSKHPLLDPRYLRVPRFLCANVVAFCAYFATFAVFFFTALYLAEVVNDSGYQIAEVFLPMMAFMIISALFAGRWITAAGPRWSILIGCVIFGTGLLLTTLTLTTHPSYLPLALTLSLTGVGIGTTLVPTTATAMSAVPAERSGMAASAANTSREIGAVTGTAVLGSLVISQLLTNLNVSMGHYGIPSFYRALAERVILTGGISSGSGSAGVAGAGEGKLIVEMTNAAYAAFHDGLHAALFVSGLLVFAAGLFSFALMSRKPQVVMTGQGSGTPGNGSGAHAQGNGSVAQGYGPTTHGNGSASDGYGSATQGYGSRDEGYGSAGEGYSSAGEGYGSGTEGYGSAGEGYGSAGEGYGSGTEGYGSAGEGYGSGTEGYGSTGQEYGSTTQGYPHRRI
jgi:EmrB/QacA subfamily drug resistance transporter